VLRRVKYIPPDHNYDEFGDDIMANGIFGWFHKWVDDIEDFGSGPMYTPRAIVQRDSGAIDLVFPTGIIFLDPPVEALIAGLTSALDSENPKAVIVNVVNEFYQT
jgi:hypothetical protein